jgi:hypothetical protein
MESGVDLLDNLREELKHVGEGVEGAFTSQNARDCSQREQPRGSGLIPLLNRIRGAP